MRVLALLHGVLAVAPWALAACKEPNPDFMPDASSTGGSDSQGETSTASTTGVSDATTIGSSFTVSSTTASSETTDDPTTTEPGSTGASTTTDPTTGGGSDPTYPACDADTPTMCPRGFDECIPVQAGGWCTVHCEDPSTCPVPVSGNAEVVCAGPSGNQCALDCGGGKTCPDGMGCTHIQGTIYRCVWS